MDSEYAIREAKGSDLDTLIAFTVQEAKETEGTGPALAAVRLGVDSGLEGSAPVSYWVAQSGGGQVVGSISVVTEWSNFRGRYYWWIQSLFIQPEHRGTGLVDVLLDFLAEAAETSGAIDLRLYAENSNARALAAYHRCGFSVAPYTIMTRQFRRR